MFDVEQVALAAKELTALVSGDDPGPVALAGDDELLCSLQELERLRRALDAAESAVAGEVDARGLADRRFGHRTKDWLATSQGLERREAARRVRVGAKLRQLPEITAALADGRITFEHARVVTDLLNDRVRGVIVGLQAQIVELAEGVRFERWARDVRALVDLADQDGGHNPREEQDRLFASFGMDGVLHLRGTLRGDAAAEVAHLLHVTADKMFRRASNALRATGLDPAVDPPGGLDRAQCRAQAMVELVRAGASTASPKAPVSDVSLVIPVDHPALRGKPGPGVPAGSGGYLDSRTVDLLACDAAFTAVVVDSLGTPLDMGTAVRFATPAQRRAVHVRDGGCVFPGCDAGPDWCDLHHVVRVADGGSTDLENLAAVCRYHHGVLHRTGWTMRHTGGQCFEITTPTGRQLRAQRHGRPPDPPPVRPGDATPP